MDVYDFLSQFESVAIAHGLRLCMTRAPLGCDLYFSFTDDQTKDKSELYCFDTKRDSFENLFKNLERIAEAFKERE